MARLKNQKVFDQNRARLLELGVELIRSRSFQSIGIKDILKLARIPKGSFYHYFENKEVFGLQVAQFYHDDQIRSAAGRLAIPYFGLYCAGKWALEAYAESTHYELEPYGIESILIEPSAHSTELVNTTPKPADTKRIEEYGHLAKGSEYLLAMFKNMFDQGESITDAQNVANEITKLVELQAPHPIRTQVGSDMGVTAINEQTVPVQSALINQLKLIYQEA